MMPASMLPPSMAATAEQLISERLRNQVAFDDFRIRGGGPELVHDARGENPADAVVAGDAAVDLEDGHVLILGIDLLPRSVK